MKKLQLYINSISRFCISIDQATLEKHKIVQGEGGVIGITSNENALNMLMVVDPEVCGLMDEFQSSINALLKYEQSPTVQKTFCEKVVSLKLTTSHYKSICEGCEYFL